MSETDFSSLIDQKQPLPGMPKLFIGMPIFWSVPKQLYIIISVNTPFKAISLEAFLRGGRSADMNCHDYISKRNNLWTLPGEASCRFDTEEIKDWQSALILLRKENSLYCLATDKYWSGYSQNEESVWIPTGKWFNGGLPVPSSLADLIFNPDSISDTSSPLALKQQNTDGRNICARCGGPIKKLQGFGQNYNYCPVCEK